MSDSPQYDTLGRLTQLTQYHTAGIFYEKFGRITQRSMTPKGDWLPAVSYPREISPKKITIDSAQYHTAGRLTQRSLMPMETDSAQYHTPGRFRKIRITHWKLNQNRKYFNSLVSVPGRFKRWKIWKSKISWDCFFSPLVSVPARPVWIMKKSGGRNSCWTVPLMIIPEN